MACTDDYGPTNLILLQKILGPSDSMTAGRMWFIEALVWTLLAVAVVCFVPTGDRLERRWPFGFAMAFLTLGLALRYDVVGLEMGRAAWFGMLAFWFFAVGWAAAKADTVWQRAVISVVALIALHGYFGSGQREALVAAGLLLLIWLPALRCPTTVAVAAGVIAEASLYTYLTHFQIYPAFGHPLPGVFAALLVGVGLTWCVNALRRGFRTRETRRRRPTAPQRRHESGHPAP